MKLRGGSRKRLLLAALACLVLVGCGFSSGGKSRPLPTATSSPPTPTASPTVVSVDPKLVDHTMAELGAGYILRGDAAAEAPYVAWERVLRGSSKTRFASVLSLRQVTESSTQTLILTAEVAAGLMSKYPDATQLDLPARHLRCHHVQPHGSVDS
jgi:hypothetical protein